MHLSPLSLAVQNNALWCNTICQTHSISCEFLEGIWINRHKSPPFYPNAITLAGSELADGQRSHIIQLLKSDLPDEWAVKDSYAALNLFDLNFSTLFEAEWIYRNPETIVHTSSQQDIHYDTIQNESDLLKWETAWYGNTEAVQTRIFLPSLLKLQHVAIISAQQHGTIVAGAIASQTEGAVGISNLFFPDSGSLELCAGCIKTAVEVFPHLPLVGYESSVELEIMNQLGFESIGDLRVWLRNTD